MNSINQKLKKINKKLNKASRRRKMPLRRIKRVFNLRKRIRRFRRNNRRRMPAAYVRNFRKEFSILRQTGTSMRVRGKDLIYKIPDVVSDQPNTSIITIIPANPAYWTGTRMAAISAGYQNYRPIIFKIHYVPQCAVTQQGNVLGGTVWAMTPNIENIQQTLRTSNGGMLTQCYKNATSNIELGSNLQFNLFRMGGKFDQESNPFIYLGIAIATLDQNSQKINPGYFYVEYEYELKNPIGDTIKYYNSGVTTFNSLEDEYVNESLINCSANNSINVGAIIQKDGTSYTWNDKPVTFNENDVVWYFCNDIINRNQNITISSSELTTYEYDSVTINANTKAYFITDVDEHWILLEINNPTENIQTIYLNQEGSNYKINETTFNRINDAAGELIIHEINNIVSTVEVTKSYYLVDASINIGE